MFDAKVLPSFGGCAQAHAHPREGAHAYARENPFANFLQPVPDSPVPFPSPLKFTRTMP